MSTKSEIKKERLAWKRWMLYQRSGYATSAERASVPMPGKTRRGAGTG